MEPCPFCLSDIPAAATRCRHCGGDLTKPVEGPDLSNFWLIGGVLAVIGIAIAVGADSWFGYVVAGVGGIFLQVATIAWGVSIGQRDRDQRTWAQRHANAEDVQA